VTKSGKDGDASRVPDYGVHAAALTLASRTASHTIMTTFIPSVEIDCSFFLDTNMRKCDKHSEQLT